MDSWILQPVLHPLWLLVIAMVLAGMQWIRPTFGQMNARRRLVLVALRSASIALVLLMLLRPGCITTERRAQSAVLLMLVDISRSMELPHDATSDSRWEVLRRTFFQTREQLARLAEQSIEVRWLGFDNKLKPAPNGDALWADEKLQPRGAETDIGTTLAAALRSVREQRLLGVVLASDGVQNAMDPEVEPIAAADLVAAVEAPLYTIALGPPADAGQSADIAVVSMPDHFRGVVKNQQTIQSVVRIRGFTNRDITAQLVVTDPEGREQVVASRKLRVAQDDQEVPLNLSLTPVVPGNYRVTVRLEPQAEEVTSINNELSAFMTIFAGGLKVLYLHADASPENKFLRWALGSSEEIQLDDLSVLTRDRARWPLDYEDLIRDGNYDAFILENVDSRALSVPTLEAIAVAVEGGKGLIMLGGTHSFGPGLYSQTPLADLLPVKMDLVERQDFDAPIREQLHIDRELKLRPATSHFVTNLGDESDETWNRLPAVAGANVLTPKDNAQILLETEEGRPILISQVVGGRVLAMATASTWRWYLGGSPESFREQFKRFWRQVMLWLVFRDGLSESNVNIELAQRRFEPFAAVDFGLEARTAVGGTIRDSQFTATLRDPQGGTVTLPVTQTDSGSRGFIDRQYLSEPGLYTIDVAGSDPQTQQAIGTAQAQFMVYDRDKEKSNPAGDADQLSRLSAQTRDWGGRMVRPEEFAGLLDAILENPPDMEIEVPRKWLLGDTTADGLTFLFCFVGLLTSEWLLRKRWGLV